MSKTLNPIVLAMNFEPSNEAAKTGKRKFTKGNAEATIREIQKTDNDTVAKVIRKTLEDIGMPKVGTAYADKSLDTMYETYQAERSKYYVLEMGGKVVGGGGIAPLDNFEGNVCELQKMYFLPEARGTGLGYEMLKICLET
ncbi:MAG: GNAT family N-acetyltransferase, partial [Flavobacteriaceae bacterium]|nr:GNAT family N-acetyltransferase [Flavobacteriaceae bacterium]